MSASEHQGISNITVRQIIRETPDTTTFVFDTPANGLNYKAGQFLTFVFRNNAGNEVRRSYSFSSSPDAGEEITITVKRISNGEFSRYMTDKVRPGTVLEIIGASGFFVLPENMTPYHTIVFIAAGSGITPVFSLLKSAALLYPQLNILLIYGNRDVANTIFRDRLEQLRTSHPRLRIEYLFSASKDVNRSHLTPDILERLLNRHQIYAYDRTLFYICGPTGFMRMAGYKLASLGVSPANIKREIFHIRPRAEIPAPPDTGMHIVKLWKGTKEFRFRVQYPVSILQAAKLLHIDIPFSCENGQCGTCVAECLQGEVWMSGNEVLLQEDVDKGLILTCTGFPVNGDVTLKI